MRKQVMIAALLLQVFIFWVDPWSNSANSDDSEFCSKDLEKIIEKRSGNYRIQISYANDRMCQRLDIHQGNQLVFREEGIDNHYFLGNEDGIGDTRSIINMTGQGPQLIVKKWTGGMHCCNSLLIFDLGKKLKKIAEIYTGNFDAEIVDVDRDGIPEIRLLDDFLAYRFSSFAYSAAAEVVLRYTAAGYSVAPKFMKRDAPNPRSLKARIPRWRKLLRDHSDPDFPPPPLIQAMTNLIFTGNERAAFDLLDSTWPSDVAGKADFLNAYRSALNESRYYPELKRLEAVH